MYNINFYLWKSAFIDWFNQNFNKNHKDNEIGIPKDFDAVLLF